MKPQTKRVLEYMKTRGSITGREAFTKLGCTQLASRINELEKEGYIFYKEQKKGVNRYGEAIRYKRYSIMSEPEERRAE